MLADLSLVTLNHKSTGNQTLLATPSRWEMEKWGFSSSVNTLLRFYLGEVSNCILLVVMYITVIIMNYINEVGLLPALDLSCDFPVRGNLEINDLHSGKRLV